jgi:UDP-glucose 4-epimerase
MKYESIFVSDIHLGAIFSQAEQLIQWKENYDDLYVICQTKLAWEKKV